MMAALVTTLLIVRLWRINQTSSVTMPSLFRRKAYLFSVVAEVLAIYVASAVSTRFGFREYFIQIVGIIVGLHFIGLWAATRSKRFLAIAGGMCIVSTVSIPLPAMAHFDQREGRFHGLR
ncbi:hypothetical protein ASG11_04855 [Sphingomonas sp. Leaf357]|nr:hypothetical protein ASG11_04855 [Sphingomonas sp. Leaf357]